MDDERVYVMGDLVMAPGVINITTHLDMSDGCVTFYAALYNEPSCPVVEQNV